MSAAKRPQSSLFYGDNLKVMREKVQDETVDLVYLDPPFKSDLNYNLLFRTDGLRADEAQMTAFKDTWIWDEGAQYAYEEIQALSNVDLVNLINSLFSGLGRVPMMAYVVNMAIRLVEIRKKLKPEGSIYLHCDPSAVHYLRMIMDFVFGPTNFRNEIIWRRTGSHNSARRFGPIHDNILFYSKSSVYTWIGLKRPYMRGHVAQAFVKEGNRYRTNYSGNVLTGSGRRNGESGQPWHGYNPDSKGRHWAIPSVLLEGFEDETDGMTQHQKLDFLLGQGCITIKETDEWPRYQRWITSEDGQKLSDLWAYQPYSEGTVFGVDAGIDDDVRWMGTKDNERLGYPTQKPLGLMERIVASSSRQGDLVLDPFCGCGTTIEAAQKLGRRWIGIDISPFAIQLIRKTRLGGAFPELDAGTDYEIDGLPTTIDGARLLAEQDPKAFEIWAVSIIDGIPNGKKGADRGLDGRIPFRPDGKATKFAAVSVKSGKLKADDIRSLMAVADREKSTSLGFGVFLCLEHPTQGMKTDAASVGSIEVGERKYPLIQILTLEDVLAGKRPRLPLLDATPYRKAPRSDRQRPLL